MLKVTGLWLNEDKNKNKYFSGSMGGVRIIIMKNTFKEEGSNEPDYNMYFEENKPKVKETPKVSGEDDPF